MVSHQMPSAKSFVLVRPAGSATPSLPPAKRDSSMLGPSAARDGMSWSVVQARCRRFREAESRLPAEAQSVVRYAVAALAVMGSDLDDSRAAHARRERRSLQALRRDVPR